MRESTYAAFQPDVIAEHVRPPEYAGLVARARRRRRRRIAAIGVATAVAVAIVATVPVVLSRGAGRDAVTDAPVGSGRADFDRRAVEMIAGWTDGGLAYVAELGFVPSRMNGTLTLLPEGWPVRDDGVYEWESPTPSPEYRAYLAGRFRLVGPLSTDRPPGTVSIRGGPTITVPLASAQDTYLTLDRADVAPGCTGDECLELPVTAATLGWVDLMLDGGGRATVPAWLFTVDGLSVPIARVALASSAETTAPLRLPDELFPLSPDAPRWAVVHAVATRSGTNRLEYRFQGGLCDAGRTPVVYETRDFVVVGVDIVAERKACFSVGVDATAEVTLTRPLGDRVVLSVADGFPVRVT
jgi:hypothetical protein